MRVSGKGDGLKENEPTSNTRRRREREDKAVRRYYTAQGANEAKNKTLRKKTKRSNTIKEVAFSITAVVMTESGVAEQQQKRRRE